MSLMRQEASEAPEAVARFLTRNATALAVLGRRLRKLDPPVVLTSARGSPQRSRIPQVPHRTALGIPAPRWGPPWHQSMQRPRVQNGLSVTISQSGKSPDIVALQDAARRSGALTVAIVNVDDLPAAAGCHICLPLHAGAERAWPRQNPSSCRWSPPRQSSRNGARMMP